MRPSEAASVARGPARLPLRACVPSHERDAGVARARFLRRRLIESSPSKLRPGRQATRGANAMPSPQPTSSMR